MLENNISITQSIINLASVRETIASYQLSARKSLGQNFLLDLNLTTKIARAAGDLTTCDVIEIGPGPGGLTRALLMQGARKIYAIEFDPRAVTALQPLVQAAQGRLEVIHADALTIDYADLIKLEKVKLVANLPYNIATTLLLKWLNHYQLFHSLTLMFQKEVADRLTAECDTSAYGRLSVITQWFMESKVLFNIPPEAFFPAPKIVSSMVHFQPRVQPFRNIDKKILERLLLVAFGQRRKMLRVTLKGLFANIESVLNSEGIDSTRRAETLSLDEFGRLAERLQLS